MSLSCLHEKGFIKKKLLCVVPALLLFAMVGAPNARADSYTPTFSCVPGGVGSDFQCPFSELNAVTAPDVSFPAPTSIVVTVVTEPAVFDLNLAPPDSPSDTYEWGYSDGGPFAGYSYAGFVLTDETTNLSDSVTLYEQGLPLTFGLIESGPLVFSPASAATPEPTPVILMLLGVGLVFLMRRRLFARTPGAI